MEVKLKVKIKEALMEQCLIEHGYKEYTSLPLSENHLLNKECALTSTNWHWGYLLGDNNKEEAKMSCK